MRDVLWIARTAWWFGAALGQMDSLHSHCALLLSLGHFSVSQLSFILPLYPLNHFYPVFFCPSRLCVCSPPIIFIPMWIEFGVLDIPLKVGSWKLSMGSLIIIKRSVSVMGYGFDQNFQANHKSPGKILQNQSYGNRKLTILLREAWLWKSSFFSSLFHCVCPRMFGLI